jgi:negative regulator of replication initiation
MVIFYQFKKIALVLFVVLGSSGCAAIDDGSTTIKPESLSSYSQDPSSEVGSRNNPIALGVPVVISDWKVQIISVNKDALQLVLDSDAYAMRPSSGERFMMIKVKATYIGEESGEPSSDLRFKIVGSRGNTFANSCGYSSDTFSENGEAFPGAAVIGNLCFTVDANQIAGATVSIQGGYSSENRKFVSLDSN